MNRFWDYSGFAVWFIGLGYIVTWPLTMSDFGQTASAATICGGDALPPGFLCSSAHGLMLPPGLHLAGGLAAVFVTLRLLTMAIKRAIRGRKTPTVTPPVASPPQARAPHRSISRVKPRTHFGLRGSPR
jgi:hypothetical protein